MDQETWILSHSLPGILTDKNFAITSPQDPFYNCIAWADEVNDKCFWPFLPEDPEDFDDEFEEEEIYWPKELPLDDSIDNFIRFFSLRGYELADSLSWENGCIKIALFVKDGKCTHAARLLSDGSWTSKLGPLNDVRHSLQALEGDFYGTVRCIMQRKSDNSR